VKCQYFGLLPAFGAVILCGGLLWWDRVVSAAQNRTPHRLKSRPERKRKSFQSQSAPGWRGGYRGAQSLGNPHRRDGRGNAEGDAVRFKDEGNPLGLREGADHRSER
jgi:hypothetical protein